MANRRTAPAAPARPAADQYVPTPDVPPQGRSVASSDPLHPCESKTSCLRLQASPDGPRPGRCPMITHGTTSSFASATSSAALIITHRNFGWRPRSPDKNRTCARGLGNRRAVGVNGDRVRASSGVARHCTGTGPARVAECPWTMRGGVRLTPSLDSYVSGLTHSLDTWGSFDRQSDRFVSRAPGWVRRVCRVLSDGFVPATSPRRGGALRNEQEWRFVLREPQNPRSLLIFRSGTASLAAGCGYGAVTHRARSASKSMSPPETGRGRPQGPGRPVSGGSG